MFPVVLCQTGVIMKHVARILSFIIEFFYNETPICFITEFFRIKLYLVIIEFCE